MRSDIPVQALGVTDDANVNVPKSWSFGVDNRKPYGIAEFGVASSPINRIGLLSKTIGTDTFNCTATFVGTPTSGYYIITAAHCFWTLRSAAPASATPEARSSSAGRRAGTEARVCVHGELRTTDCSATRCARLPETGVAGCAAPPDL